MVTKIGFLEVPYSYIPVWLGTILFVLQWRTAASIAGTKNTGVTYQTATGDVKIVDEFIGTRETSSPVKLRSMGMMSSLVNLNTAIQL